MMKETDFKKGLREMQSLKLTDQERAAILERVLATPIPSPYARYLRALVFVKKPAAAIMMACLILVVSTSGLVYASQVALPGDALYSVKTKLIEPILDKVNTTPEEKVVWEAEKVSRRLEEAHQLSVEHRLDEAKTQALKEGIEKSAAAFATAAEKASAGIATSTKMREEHTEKLKQDFREKLEKRKADDPGEERLDELKDRAVQALDLRKGEGGHRGKE